MKKRECEKNEVRLRNLQDIFKHSNIQIIGVPEGEKEDQEIENLFENIMKENFPNLAKEIDVQEVQETQRVPKKLDPRKHTPRHIIITLPKIKRKDLHPRLLYPAKLSFRMEGHARTGKTEGNRQREAFFMRDTEQGVYQHLSLSASH